MSDIENRTFDEIKVGDSVSLSRTLTKQDIELFAVMSGDPSSEAGEILVSYDAQGSGWRLSVSDNGVGPGDASAEMAHTGLGTSIVEALARQLNATVEKSGGTQGTTVSIVASAAAGDA